MSIVLVGTLALANAGAASAAKGGTERPWKGFGGAVVNLETAEASGWGVATHEGKYTASQQFSSPSESVAIVTAANGDQIFETLTTSAPVNGTYSFTVTVTGGTGRFEGATGSAVGEGTVVRSTATEIELEVWFSGTISY